MGIKNVGEDDHGTPPHFMHNTLYRHSQHPMNKVILKKLHKNYHLSKRAGKI